MIRDSAQLGVLKGFKALFSFLTVYLSARYFGASLDRDAWVIGLAVQAACLQFAFGPINEIFRTKFVYVREEQGISRALEQLAEWIGATIFFTTFVVLAIEFSRDFLSTWVAAGFTFEQQQKVSLMILWLAPLIFFQQIFNFWSATLNIFGHYYVADLWSMVGAGFQVASILLFADKYGIYSLVFGLYLNWSVSCIALGVLLRRKEGFLYLRFPRILTLQSYGRLAAPFYLPIVTSQVVVLVEKSLSSILGVGVASVLDYARKLIELPSGIILSVTQTIFTPQIASFHSNQDYASASRSLGKYLKFTTLSAVLFSAFLFALASWIVEIVLVHGAFSEDYVPATTLLLRWFSVGFVGAVWCSVGSQHLIGRNRVTASALIAVVTQFVMTGINILYYREVGVSIFAVSWTIANFVSGAALLRLSRSS